MNYLGIDFHKRYSVATLIDEQGCVLEKRKLLNRKEDFTEFLASHSEISAVVEACRTWPIAAELLEGLADEVTLAHPYKTKAIASAKVKTDTIDSETLAQLLRADLIPKAYLREAKNQQEQRILRTRSFYVKLSTQVKNRVHAIVDMQTESIRETAKGFTDLFGKKGLAWLENLDVPEPDKSLLRRLLESYAHIRGKVKETDWLIKELIAKDPDCALLKTIPGLGDFLSCLVKVEIGDISRFSSSSHLSSYAGLVPSTYSSGGKSWNGRITKEGNKWLRWAMVEAVIPAITSHAELRRHYELVKSRKGSKIAKVATARRLLCIVYRVLKEKDSFKTYKDHFRKRPSSGKVYVAEPPSRLYSAV